MFPRWFYSEASPKPAKLLPARRQWHRQGRAGTIPGPRCWSRTKPLGTAPPSLLHSQKLPVVAESLLL